MRDGRHASDCVFDYCRSAGSPPLPQPDVEGTVSHGENRDSRRATAPRGYLPRSRCLISFLTPPISNLRCQPNASSCGAAARGSDGAVRGTLRSRSERDDELAIAWLRGARVPSTGRRSRRASHRPHTNLFPSPGFQGCIGGQREPRCRNGHPETDRHHDPVANQRRSVNPSAAGTTIPPPVWRDQCGLVTVGKKRIILDRREMVVLEGLEGKVSPPLFDHATQRLAKSPTHQMLL